MKLFNKIKNLKKNKSLHHLEAYAEKAKAIFGPVSSKTGREKTDNVKYFSHI
jgi:hypothetical protein